MPMLSVKALESYLARLYQDLSGDTGLFMKLVEEIGEVAECLNVRDHRKGGTAEDDALAGELADVIHYAVGIAAVNGIDLERAILEKDERAARKYHHEENLAQYLARQREE